MWITTLISIVLIIFFLYLYLSITCHFTVPTFLTAYEVEHDNSGSRELAFKAAINIFRKRPPFDILKDEDIDRLVSIFCLLPNAKEAAQIMRTVDRQRDASKLCNKGFLDKLENSYREMNV